MTTEGGDSVDVSESSLSLVDTIRGALEPQGWVVAVDSTPVRIRVVVSHVLSGRHGLTWRDDGADYSDFVTTALSNREFAAVASKPDALPHEALLGSIRVSARANRWTTDIVAAVARILRDEKLLTEDEALWLEDAGPAWQDETSSSPAPS